MEEDEDKNVIEHTGFDNPVYKFIHVLYLKKHHTAVQ